MYKLRTARVKNKGRKTSTNNKLPTNVPTSGGQLPAIDDLNGSQQYPTSTQTLKWPSNVNIQTMPFYILRT